MRLQFTWAYVLKFFAQHILIYPGPDINPQNIYKTFSQETQNQLNGVAYL